MCLSLGSSGTLRYAWGAPNSSDACNGHKIDIESGDVYVMSETASGFGWDWVRRSLWRIVCMVQEVNSLFAFKKEVIC